MALTSKLAAIGDAIREKTGETAKLTLAEMPDAIASIQGGGGAKVKLPTIEKRIPNFYYTTGGVQTAYNGWDMSDYMEVSQYDKIEFDGTSWGNYNVFFDASLKKVGNNPTFNGSNKVASVPAGAVYLGVSASAGDYSAGVFYGVLGTPEVQETKAYTATANGSTTIKPDVGFDFIGEVALTVDVPIPEGYIVPSGEAVLDSNGTHDVRQYETARVAVPAPTYDTPSITVSSGGLITASANGKSGTQQLTTQAGKTVTPTKSQQTAVASGRYTTGAVNVAAIPSEYIVPSGSQTLNENKAYDVTSLASVTVAVPIPTFVTVYTGSSDPASSLGSNGDLYLRLS